MSGVRMAKVEVEAVEDRVTIQEAARRLGIKEDGVRKRIQRGTLDHEKDPDGRVYVFLDQTHDTSQYESSHRSKDFSQNLAKDKVQDVSEDMLVETLQDQIRYLRDIIETRDRELESRTDELKRKDTIIMSLAQRVPELTSTSSQEDPRDHDGLVRSSKTDEDVMAKGSTEATKRRWWSRLFGE